MTPSGFFIQSVPVQVLPAFPYAMASSRAILSSIGGCVLKSFVIPPPLKGLTINM